MRLPQRKILPHTPPGFVADGAVYFSTINCETRGRNQLANDPTWSVMRTAVVHYHTTGRWYVRLFLAMPDHVHALVSFPRVESMKQVVQAWKHYVARYGAVAWQRDFFDHRLRKDESLQEKHDYIRNNPVREALCARSEAWTYWWIPPDLVATPPD